MTQLSSLLVVTKVLFTSQFCDLFPLTSYYISEKDVANTLGAGWGKCYPVKRE